MSGRTLGRVRRSDLLRPSLGASPFPIDVFGLVL